jgi:hypothetical protein
MASQLVLQEYCAHGLLPGLHDDMDMTRTYTNQAVLIRDSDTIPTMDTELEISGGQT